LSWVNNWKETLTTCTCICIKINSFFICERVGRTRLLEKLLNIFLPALEIPSLPFQVMYLLLLAFNKKIIKCFIVWNEENKEIIRPFTSYCLNTLTCLHDNFQVKGPNVIVELPKTNYYNVTIHKYVNQAMS